VLTNPTFKTLIRQLRDARKEISHLKGEGLDERKNLKDPMDMYLESIDKDRFTTKRFFPFIGSLGIYTGRIGIYNLISERSSWSYNLSNMNYLK
jgi:hypothetical protein